MKFNKVIFFLGWATGTIGFGLGLELAKQGIGI